MYTKSISVLMGASLCYQVLKGALGRRSTTQYNVFFGSGVSFPKSENISDCAWRLYIFNGKTVLQTGTELFERHGHAGKEALT